MRVVVLLFEWLVILSVPIALVAQFLSVGRDPDGLRPRRLWLRPALGLNTFYVLLIVVVWFFNLIHVRWLGFTYYSLWWLMGAILLAVATYLAKRDRSTGSNIAAWTLGFMASIFLVYNARFFVRLDRFNLDRTTWLLIALMVAVLVFIIALGRAKTGLAIVAGIVALSLIGFGAGTNLYDQWGRPTVAAPSTAHNGQTFTKTQALAACALKGGELDYATMLCTKTVTKTVEAPLTGYDLHYYSLDKGVAGGNFGPACVPNGDAQKCIVDLEGRVKHDPDLACVQLRNFGLLAGVTSTSSVSQVEALRKECSTKLAASAELRRQYATELFGVLEFARHLKPTLVPLSGTYYTEWIDSQHQIHQGTATMDPKKNIAIVLTDLDGNIHMVKLDCGHQTVSKVPIPGVPPKQPPERKVCLKTACGINGVDAPPVSAGVPGGTPGYSSGTAESVAPQQTPPSDPYAPNPTYGSHPSAPPGAGAPSDPPGTSGGVASPTSTPNPGGATAQPSTAPTSGGNPCENPSTPGCGP